MRKQRDAKTGSVSFLFEKGDGILKRWAPLMETWRLKSPVNRKLYHAHAWYLEEKNLAARPSMGLVSLAIFAEHVLYKAYMECPGSRALLKAQRLFATVQKKMRQLRYRGGKDGRLRNKVERGYLLSSISSLVGMARVTWGAVSSEAKRARVASAKEALD